MPLLLQGILLILSNLMPKLNDEYKLWMYLRLNAKTQWKGEVKNVNTYSIRLFNFFFILNIFPSIDLFFSWIITEMSIFRWKKTLSSSVIWDPQNCWVGSTVCSWSNEIDSLCNAAKKWRQAKIRNNVAVIKPVAAKSEEILLTVLS